MSMQRYMVGVRRDFVYMCMRMCVNLGRVRTILNGSAIFYHSLNYTQLCYYLDVVTRGLFSCSRIWLYVFVGIFCVFPHIISGDFMLYVTLSHGEHSSFLSFIFSFGKEIISSFLLIFFLQVQGTHIPLSYIFI